MAMLRKLAFVFTVIILLTPGCIDLQTVGMDSAVEEKSIPFELTFSSQTLDRTEDGGAMFDLKQELQDGPVMLLWIGAGCTGCHDWTDLLREKMENGTFEDSNMTLISVHRWGEFESKEEMLNVFGNSNQSDHYTPWKIITPTLETQVHDFSTGENTGTSLFSAFGNPGTPTLQVIAENGVLAWQSKTYWANETVFDDGFSFFEQQGVQE